MTCKLVIRSSVVVGLAIWLGPYGYAVCQLVAW
jgi:hypothetical protein